MCKLIDHDLAIWKKSLVQDCFVHSATNQILSIPISMRLPEDKIIWNYEKDGVYHF